MKKLFKSIFYFVFVMFFIIVYSFFDMAKTTRATFVISGILQGNIVSYKASGEPYRGAMVGGMPFLVSKISELKKKAQKSRSAFYLLDCGDDFPGTAHSYYSQCRAVVDTMNLMGVTAMLLGNRELDYGFEVLKARARDANFPILAANVRNKNDGAPFAEFQDSLILPVDDAGFKIAVLGITPPETLTDSTIKNVSELALMGETETVEIFKRKASKEGASFTVALTQLDFEKDRQLLELLVKSGIDMVIGLDFTNQMNGIKKSGDTVLVALNGFAKGAQLTKVDVFFDTRTRRPFDFCAEVVPVAVNQIEPDGDCAKIVSDYLRKLDAIMNQVIAVSEVDLKRPFNEETNFGNLIADYMRKAASAEVAIQNAGSFRADIDSGDVTVGDFYNALPFDNDIVSIEVAGDVLYDVINATCRRERGLLQISGASYSYDANAAQSGHTAEALLSFSIGGAEIRKDKKYIVATNSFLASGQGGYPQLKNCRLVGSFGNLRESAMMHIREDKILKPSIEGRITRVSKP
ncbi:MAG: Trifunctional nucleotide phosphoesterase protein YfkN precursor [bacterium ADurb.Bin243]|nr:MAG: Trifunctional nucleotide phosphoesterase protein YfkN precursor [bacterium ADurb.Bin243]